MPIAPVWPSEPYSGLGDTGSRRLLGLHCGLWCLRLRILIYNLTIGVRGVPSAPVTEIVGAIAGGFIARYAGVTTAVTSHSIVVEIIIAFLGSILLLAVLRMVGIGKRRRLFR